MNDQSLLLIVIISILIGILLVILYINLTVKTRKVIKADNEAALLALQRGLDRLATEEEDDEEELHIEEEEDEEELQIEEEEDEEELQIEEDEDEDELQIEEEEDELQIEEEEDEEEMDHSDEDDMIEEEHMFRNVVEERIYKREVEKMETFNEKEEGERVVRKTTVLGEETFIDGEMLVNGDVEVLNKIEGDIHAHNIYVGASVISGNLICENVFQNAEETVVHGNVSAKHAEINGIVEGDLAIEGILTLGENSVVTGNIDTKEIEISRGAKLYGKISINKKK